jgi:RimJ/RimL family protein N-acetyltransferase
VNAGVVIVTERLVLRQLDTTDADANFIRSLLNEPSWLQFIGDRGVRTTEEARAYIANGPMAMYRERGFGLWLVQLAETAVPMGICGLIKRPTLDDVDVGFAFRPDFWGRGYACEAATATIAHARNVVGLKRLVAITAPGNARSIRLLEKLGLSFERTISASGSQPESRLFSIAL